jgi:pimeloyl-ACP methyl ester carboxylesterase
MSSVSSILQDCIPTIYSCAHNYPLTLWRLPTTGPKAKVARRLLCIHGFLDSGRSFARLARELPSNYEVYAPDLRGHGRSRPLSPGCSAHYWDHAKDLSVLIDQFNQAQTPFDLMIGHSMGANVASLIMGGRPQLVPQLLILDILGGMPEAPEAQAKRLGTVLQGLQKKKDFKPVGSLQEAVARLKALNPHLSAEGALWMAHANLDQQEDGTFLFAFDKELRGKTLFRFPQEFWISLFEKMKHKTWVVRGENGYLPKGEDEPLVQERLNALGLQQAHTLMDKGHHLHVDAVPELAAYIMALPPWNSPQAQQ